MGIHDDKHELESWFLQLASSAFFYALPDGFTPALIVHDMTAMMVAAFNSPKVLTGADYINHLARPITSFALGDGAASSSDSIDYTQYCSEYERTNLPANYPSLADLQAWEYADFQPKAFNAERALYILARDDSRHMPEQREMVHEKRYGNLSEKDQPFTEQEIRNMGLHVCKHRPMPGLLTLNVEELPDNMSDVRRRAARTPAIREAYQQYGPWALCQQLCDDEETGHRTVRPEDDTRFVLIDHMLTDFPAQQYEHGELLDMPRDWARGATNSQLLQLRSGRALGPLASPAVGETDLKFVWYIEHMSKPGDHILLRCNDSDMLYLMLLHMERWEASGRVIFLDCMPIAKERLHKRFVCLNLLARTLCTVSATRWPGLACPIQTIVSLALSCGSDYTRNHYYITARAIIEAFDGSDAGWKLLRNAFRIGRLETDASNDWIVEHLGGSAVVWPVTYIMHEDSFDAFVRLLFQRRIGSAYLQKEAAVPVTKRLTWGELSFHNTKRYANLKTSDKYTIPTKRESDTHLRQILWVLHYWGNAHLGIGLFPSALSRVQLPDDEEKEEAIWGWFKLPTSATEGTGTDRVISRAVYERIYGNTLDKRADDTFENVLLDNARDKKTGKVAPHCVAHARRVAPSNAIWEPFAAEWINAVERHTGPSNSHQKTNK